MSLRAKTGVVVVLLAVLLLTVAGLLWGRATASKGGDYDRCPATCNTVVKYYSMKRPTLKAHNGEKQCWQTCAARFGEGKSLSTTKDMQAFWAQHRPTYLHANQCAQACWRNYHKGSAAVKVAGLRSMPRAVTCTPGGSGRLTARVDTEPGA